jgi:hypothetical protein
MPKAPAEGGQHANRISARTPEEWHYRWSMTALQIKDTVEEKGRKSYGLPGILVLDVSRLGSAGQMPAGSWTGSSRKRWIPAS